MKKNKKIERIIRPSSVRICTQNDKLYFLPVNTASENTAGEGFIGKLQDFLKRNGHLYSFLVKTFSPVLLSHKFSSNLNKVLNQYSDTDYILNLGSGTSTFLNRPDIINVDMFDFHSVDMIADITDLPFEDNSVDCIINIAVLEHIKNPTSLINEIIRVLKPGGVLYACVPFIQPFHAAPEDYYRWTKPGLQETFKNFSDIQIFPASGPTSSMLWVLISWLAVLLSFGSRFLHDILFLLFMIILFPLKYLDLIVNHYGLESNITCCYCILCSKPVNPINNKLENESF